MNIKCLSTKFLFPKLESLALLYVGTNVLQNFQQFPFKEGGLCGVYPKNSLVKVSDSDHP